MIHMWMKSLVDKVDTSYAPNRFSRWQYVRNILWDVTKQSFRWTTLSDTWSGSS